jgi:hypothetical protein
MVARQRVPRESHGLDEEACDTCEIGLKELE